MIVLFVFVFGPDIGSKFRKKRGCTQAASVYSIVIRLSVFRFEQAVSAVESLVNYADRIRVTVEIYIEVVS